MKVSTFHDGKRFIVVFEDIDVKEEDLIKGLLNPIVVARTPEVKPIADVPEKMPDIPEILNTPYAGMTPLDVISRAADNATSKEAREAYVFICDKINKRELRETEEIGKEMKRYLANAFKNVDSVAYAEKLNEKQIARFYETYGYSIPEELKEQTREHVISAIKSFK